ncbi:organic cation transporter protein-like isoform X2 [Macrobrachium rosenbergii]|uniref:organic cation transporter protein-like isoform X2 n=1 Tax=Macrobrachium rosenbergii TaxID=79674 RepID=UPI0034D57BC1
MDKEGTQSMEESNERSVKAAPDGQANNSSKDIFKLDESGGVAGVKSFEDVLDIVGTTGKWNIVIFLLCSLSTFMSTLQSITYEFLGATPEYWCHVGPLVEANWTLEEILDLSLPSRNVTELKFCEYNNLNYTHAALIGYKESIEQIDMLPTGNGDTIACPSRTFNTSQYTSTVVTEWDLVCESRALYSTTQAASQAGILIGASTFGFLLDKFGRRRITLICVLFSLVSGLAAAASPSFIFYVIMKTLVSCFNFGCYTGCFIQVMELFSPSQRSSLGSLFVLPWAIGYMLVPGIAYIIRSWRWLQTAYSMPVILLFSYYWLLPESPRWLTTHGRYEEAVKILSAIAKSNKRHMPPEDALIVSLKGMTPPKEEAEETDAVSKIIENLKRFLVLVLKSEFRWKILVCYFCWYSVSMVYYGVSLNSGNLSTDPYMYVFLGGLIEVPSYVLLWPMLAYLGRKRSLVGLYSLCALTISIIAILLGTQDEVSTGVIMFLSLSGKLAITAAFHLIYVFTAELFPTKYRSLAVGESSMMARFGSISSPYINDLLGDYVSWGPSALFATVSVIAAFLSMFLPETKDSDLTEEKGGNVGEDQEKGIMMKGPKDNEAFENE